MCSAAGSPTVHWQNLQKAKWQMATSAPLPGDLPCSSPRPPLHICCRAQGSERSPQPTVLSVGRGPERRERVVQHLLGCESEPRQGRTVCLAELGWTGRTLQKESWASWRQDWERPGRVQPSNHKDRKPLPPASASFSLIVASGQLCTRACVLEGSVSHRLEGAQGRC